jgi:hypothetical protein
MFVLMGWPVYGEVLQLMYQQKFNDQVHYPV